MNAKQTGKHTPGPLIAAGWEGETIGVHRHKGVHAAVWTKDQKRLVAICGMADDAESMANADLYAAAPALLAALKDARAMLMLMGVSMDHEETRRIEAAIALAEPPNPAATP